MMTVAKFNLIHEQTKNEILRYQVEDLKEKLEQAELESECYRNALEDATHEIAVTAGENISYIQRIFELEKEIETLKEEVKKQKVMKELQHDLYIQEYQRRFTY